ncbi:archaeosortase/exosortase family protein [Synechococcus sp. CBW1006]|uniref:archaeosortase/exosortase family protein n=1 Tax=Synechococcus sp. CBW1006 TaxID=1353138 RepID=UPI0018CFD853|nr:archaeosortase/exosortase family protein [Synechococcus sp. CBW1006]QPN65278.1 exosortase/archaeosortase family protein [Synechococcus sp. CBW1006]
MPLSHLTARVSQALLLSFGVNAAASGRELMLAGGAIRVAGPCAGVGQIAQLLVIAGIFLLAFPLPFHRSRFWMLFAAPLVAFFGNVVRIVLLAVINASNWTNKDWWFDFFHEDTGSMVFAAISVSVFGSLYITVLEKQLRLLDER